MSHLLKLKSKNSTVQTSQTSQTSQKPSQKPALKNSQSLSHPPATPKEQKRKHYEVDPDSPDVPPSETKMREIMDELLKPIKSDISSVNEKLAELSQKQQDNQQAFNDALAMLQEKNNVITQLESDNAELKSQMNSLKKENLDIKEKFERESQDTKEKLMNLEAHSRRSNLRFHGFPEEHGENCEDIINNFLYNQGYPYRPHCIERAHRLGEKTQGKIRPIIVKFLNFRDRQKVWNDFGHNLFPKKHNTIHVREDFPHEMEVNRQQLLNVASAVLKVKLPSSQQKPFVKLIADRLYINNETYTVKTLHRLPQNLKPTTLFTPTKDNMVAFFTQNSPLSNHFPSNFEFEGINYNCMEQYLMAEKARMAKNIETLSKIMAEINPVKQKQLGKTITGLDKETWENEAPKKIFFALLAKFNQCLVCQKTLLETGDKEIFEANPFDSFWGVGLALDSEHLWNKNMHTGRNVLGRSLEEVRKCLRERQIKPAENQ